MRKLFSAIVALAMIFVALAPFATPVRAQNPVPDNPLNGREYASPNGSSYNVRWDNWSLWQPYLPPAEDRKAFEVEVEIPKLDGTFVFYGVACDLYLDRDNNGKGKENKITVGHRNSARFNTSDAKTDPVKATIVCEGGVGSGFLIQLEAADARLSNPATPIPPAATQPGPAESTQVVVVPPAVNNPAETGAPTSAQPWYMAIWTGFLAVLAWLWSVVVWIFKALGWILLALLVVLLCLSPFLLLGAVIFGGIWLMKKLVFGNGTPGLVGAALFAARGLWPTILGALGSLVALLGAIVSFVLTAMGWIFMACLALPLALLALWLFFKFVVPGIRNVWVFVTTFLGMLWTRLTNRNAPPATPAP